MVGSPAPAQSRGGEPEIIKDPERAAAYLDFTDAARGTDPGLNVASRPASERKKPPSLVTLVANEFAADVAEIWEGNLPDYLMASDGQRHVWYCWLASPRGETIRTGSAGLSCLRGYLMGSKARDMLRDAYGVSAPGLIAALRRCGTQARSQDFYPALVQLLARQDLGSKHIRHAKRLSDDAVMSIAAVPTALQSKPFFATICGPDERFIPQACWTLKRLADLGKPDDIERILQHDNPIEAMSEAVAALPFPAPPWPGTDMLRPILSIESLVELGMRFENCLKDSAHEHAVKVVNQQCFYYEWRGEEPGILTVDAIPPLGWVLEEGLGHGNRNLGPGTWSKIAGSCPREWCSSAVAEATDRALINKGCSGRSPERWSSAALPVGSGLREPTPNLGTTDDRSDDEPEELSGEDPRRRRCA